MVAFGDLILSYKNVYVKKSFILQRVFHRLKRVVKLLIRQKLKKCHDLAMEKQNREISTYIFFSISVVFSSPEYNDGMDRHIYWGGVIR